MYYRKNAPKICINTVVAFVSCIFFFLLGEFALRFIWTAWKDARDEIIHFQYSPPKSTQEFSWFRKGLPQKEKPPDTCRILALGDSLTWGDKIPKDTDIWPSKLETQLRKTLETEKIEVINLAICGFTTLNEYGLLERLGWIFDPDLIIMAYCLNDPLPVRKNFRREGAEWIYNRKNLMPLLGLHSFLERHSYFYSFVNSRFKDLQKRLSGRNLSYLYRDNFAGWIGCKSAFEAISLSAAKKKVKVILVIFPSLEPGIHTPQTYPYVSVHNKVAQIGKNCRFYVLDLLDEFIAQKRDFRAYHALQLDGHPNKRAHQIAAEAIQALIIKENLIDIE